MMPRSRSLVLAAVLLLAVVSASLAQPFFQLINSTDTYTVSTDGVSNNGFFFDLPSQPFAANLSIQASTSYSGKDAASVQPRFFLRSWAPAGTSYADANARCTGNQNINSSLSPTQCYWQDISANSQLTVLDSMNILLPRGGRYFLTVFLASAISKGQTISVSVKVSYTSCPVNSGGLSCLDVVEPLNVKAGPASPPAGSVAAGQWRYFSITIDNPASSQIIVTFHKPSTSRASLDNPELPDDLAGFYMRFGNVPELEPWYNADVVRLTTDSVANWIAPWLGTYVIGFYGGNNGTDYDFSVENSICEQLAAGAWCKSDRKPGSRPSCPTPDVLDCLSDYSQIEANAPYTVEVPASFWTYSALMVTAPQYSIVVNAVGTDVGATIVISPNAMPANNAETTALFDPSFAYATVGSVGKNPSLFTYNYARTEQYNGVSAPGWIYIALLGGAKDVNVTFSVSTAQCPSECNGVAGACDATSGRCYCPTTKDMDPNTCASTKQSEGLSTAAIVAISILVPLGVLVLLGGALFAVYWFKFRHGAYDTI